MGADFAQKSDLTGKTIQTGSLSFVILYDFFQKIMKIVSGPQNKKLISVQIFKKTHREDFFRKSNKYTLYVY